MKPTKGKYDLLFILTIVITLSCLSVLVYEIIVWIDNKQCSERISHIYNVSQNFPEIGNAILSTVQNQLVLGISREETYSILSRIAPISSSIIAHTSDGSVVEITTLKLCGFYENNFKYLVRYSKDNELMDIRLDRGD